MPEQDTADSPVKKLTQNPMLIVALVVALLGGGTGGLSLLQGQASGQDASMLIGTAEARILKRQAEALDRHRGHNAARYASREDVAAMSAKLDMVMDRLNEIHEELRDARTRRHQ